MTAWYLLILMVVMIFYSLTIHNMLIRQVTTFVSDNRQRIEKRFGPMQPVGNWDLEFIEDANHRIIITLLVINGIILLIAGGLSFILAGKTLIPIRKMVEDQNRFITDSSHELRTPLTSLKIAMEVALRDKNLSIVEAREIITENIHEVDRLQELSNRLLSLASKQDLNKQIISEEFCLSDVIKESVRDVSVLAKSKNIKLINNSNPKVVMSGNKTEIKELIGIILENGIKYSKKGGQVIVSLTAKSGYLELRISDQGIGISYRDLPRIFDRFFRGDLARTSGNTSGFGLGLSIAKKIVTDHGGTISIKSKIGQGSTFIIQLPV